ncbi:MAG: hypothetical protein GY795_02785 [Desulfobacterales bacterium]|nr:hypothetical protein [Desulfobacterales bacterium]
MAKKNKTPSAILKQKQNRLDWQNFNFLENLLVFCTEPTRRVPKESGVHFSISSSLADQAVSILFKTDRQVDPLIRQGKKPDYMTLYIKGNTCICTIIEMKGTDKKKLKHGIEQIRQLRDRLKREIRNCLPTKWKPVFQAILLTPPNSQLPLKEIQEENRKGFVILPLQYPHKFELFAYISKKIKITDRYKHQPRRDNDLNFIEELLVSQTLQTRIKDAFYSEHFKKESIYINFVHPDTDDYGVLLAENNGAIIAVKENQDNFAKRIKQELHNTGIHKKIGRFDTIN